MVKDRLGNILESDSKQDKTLSFLYETSFGKIINKLFVRRFVSNLGRIYMESFLSKPRIDKLVKSHNIDMSDYENRKFSSFNDFFTRKLAPNKRMIDMNADAVISPADSKLTVYPINEDSVYRIKGCDYKIETLLGGDTKLAKEYLGGQCFVYRLTVDNYHRYCYIDGGAEYSYRFIPGVYHTVNPVATSKIDVYGKNCRELTLLDTDNFGRIAYIEVGAMMVGRINNNHDISRFERGSEKGYFSFGGSTIIILYKKNTVVVDDDIIKNSALEIETAVRYGERVGKRGE